MGETPTRTHDLPALGWFGDELAAIAPDAEGIGGDSVGESLRDLLDALGDCLQRTACEDTAWRAQFILVDSHPGQFLFDGDRFAGVVDLDHVASGGRVRDLCKYLATDAHTLRHANELLAAYEAVWPLEEDQRHDLPRGVGRYVVVRAIRSLAHELAETKGCSQTAARFGEEWELVTRTWPNAYDGTQCQKES